MPPDRQTELLRPRPPFVTLAPPVEGSVPASQASILIVDDHPANLLALEGVLSSLGERLVRARSGEEALRILEQEDFAVVLLDIRMAGLDGFETAARIKGMERVRHLPIIFLSADSEESTLREAYARGAVDCVTKPFQPDILRAKVAVFVELFRKTEQLKLQETALQATALMSSSLDYQTTLANLARLVVPALADWCALDMVRPEGGTERLAVQHLDPAKLRFVDELELRYPPDPQAPTGVPNVIRTGKPEWLSDIPDQLLVAGAKDAEHLRLIRTLGLKSYISVPILARGRVLGVLTLVMAESGRRYSEVELHQAEDLAARAGLFVENARLFREATEARSRLERLAAELTESEVKFRSLAEAIPQQVWTAAPDGQLNFINQRVSDFFGRPPEQLLGNGWVSGVHDADLSHCVERWSDSLQHGTPYETEFRLRRGSDGSYRWHLAQALVMRNDAGEIVKWFGSNTDIDDLKRTEAEREQLIQALERSNAELDQFAYVASHDLKAPLRGIANLSQWVEEELDGKMTDEAQQHMALLRGRVHRLEALIDGILGYSRAGRTPQKAERVEVGRLLHEVVELLAPSTGTSIAIGPGMPMMLTEKVPLQQVFMNLLGNALKHGRLGDGRIAVSVKEQDAFWEFAIADDGPGIAAEFHDKVWGIFQTLQARDKVEGTGIGLAIVRKIVQAKGGRTRLESSEGAGAIFYFTWPRSRASTHG